VRIAHKTTIAGATEKDLVRKSYRRPPKPASGSPDNHAPFIVDMDASLFKKFPQLSRNAQHLYVNLRFLADGKTGELRHKDRTWMKATFIQKKSGLCRNVRLRSMAELISVGLVVLERPRKMQMIEGRLRAVSGGSQYTVFKSPQAQVDRKPNDSSKVPLQKSRSSTVEEKDSQVFPITPIGVGSFSGSSNPQKHLKTKHDTARQINCRAAASQILPSTTNPTPEPQQRHFKPKKLLVRFARLLNYPIIEADGRLGWILHRALQRKKGDRILNDWAYVIKANKNFDDQHQSQPGGVGPFIEKFSYAEMTGIRVLQCPHCRLSVTAGGYCNCEAPL
jgi:hypothetical protein